MIDKCKFGQRFCRVPAFHIYRFTITTIPAMNYVSSKGIENPKFVWSKKNSNPSLLFPEQTLKMAANDASGQVRATICAE
jgi:hypothetical protein